MNRFNFGNFNFKNDQLPALALIALGGFFLIAQIFNISIGGLLWPFFIIAPGVLFLYVALTGGQGQARMIFPGSIITGTGAILLYQNITNHWESWAYAWTLYPVLVGLALVYHGKAIGNNPERKTGRTMVTLGLVGFVVLSALFEILIFNNFFGGISSYVWPVVLIGLGFLLLYRDRLPIIGSRSASEKPKNGTASAQRLNGTSAQASAASVVDPDLRRKIDEALAEDEETGTGA